MVNSHSVNISGGFLSHGGTPVPLIPLGLPHFRILDLSLAETKTQEAWLNHGVSQKKVETPWQGWFLASTTMGLWHNSSLYPLVNVYIAMERSTIFNGKTHYFYGHFQ